VTLQLDDLSMPNLISTGLFDNRAAAVIPVGAERPSREPAILGTRSVFYPDTEDIMGWAISEKGFRIVLSPRLPELIRQRLGADLDYFLADFGLTRRDIGIWVIQTDGPKILEAVEPALALSDRDLRLSWECLRRHCNISSASVPARLGRDDHISTFGPGYARSARGDGPGFLLRIDPHAVVIDGA